MTYLLKILTFYSYVRSPEGTRLTKHAGYGLSRQWGNKEGAYDQENKDVTNIFLVIVLGTMKR